MEKRSKAGNYGLFTIPYDERHSCYINAGEDYTDVKQYPKDKELNHPKTHNKDIRYEKKQ